MYNKDLNEDLRLRLSTQYMDFLRNLSKERGVSVSECIRSIIGEYKRSIDIIGSLNNTITALSELKELSDGDTKTNKHNFI